jgi:hypothetical protein
MIDIRPLHIPARGTEAADRFDVLSVLIEEIRDRQFSDAR